MKNLGLIETVNLAKNALPKDSTESFTSGNHNIKTGGSYSSLSLTKGDGRYVFIETTSHEEGSFCAIGYREFDSSNINVVHLPRKSGYVAIANEHYSKSESDSRFIQLNTNTKTSGYILAKTVNYYDDPNSRHLGRSGFLRPNGIDNLGALAIHIAHPGVDSSQHAHGLSFGYGGYSEAFSISTYAFDENGNFRGKRKILTEDDILVGIPLPWSKPTAPAGYLICSGQQFNKSMYPKLGEAYPSGTLPDLRGEFIRGWDNGRSIDSGREILSHQDSTKLPNLYTHAASANIGVLVSPPINRFSSNYPSEIMASDFEEAEFGSGQYFSTQLSPYGSVSLSTIRVRPRNIAFNYIVRAA
ncbi:tail fiber protein [Photorhabdus noenieputensis]|uniref:phage tail protein n=1 Tax=Photorhabdus noenieputensis TaxID=1208607 RepID=UPI001BD52A46|nr:phage tail protein [Photorhabdus noenieputensis]MBS9436787.1 tail fiber protein [Photorhabdus noenieputensis]MCK3669559.1 phage tail protein [Photorhabdus noenieputensis]